MSPTRITSRLAWILPVFFFLLSGHQLKVAYDLDATRSAGTPAEAEVLTVHLERRVDVTYDYISLRIPLPDGGTLTKEKLTLPHSLVPALKDRETLQVRVRPGAARDAPRPHARDGPRRATERRGGMPVVDTQWRIAAMNAAISLGAALIFGIGVFFWNRTLRESGDPAERGVSSPDPDHPARQVVR